MGCGSRHWETGNATRVYSKTYSELDKRQSFRAVPGKRMSYRIDALQSRINLYEICKERDATRVIIQKILDLEDGDEAYKQLEELLAKLNWNSSNYPPRNWDDLIIETHDEMEKVSKSYTSKLNKAPTLGRINAKGRFVPQ